MEAEFELQDVTMLSAGNSSSEDDNSDTKLVRLVDDNGSLDKSTAKERLLPASRRPTFSLRRRLQLCVGMLALESFISFEEIFMVSVLQRFSVPTIFLSMPGTVSSLIGIFIIPLIGWASDRFRPCSKYFGQKRPYAVYTLLVCIAGVSLLSGVNVSWLYYHSRGLNSTHINSSSSLNTSTEEILQDLSLSSESTVNRLSSATTAGILNSTILDTVSTTVSPATNSSGSGVLFIPTVGLLAMIGFTMADHGYDMSMSTFKTYMISVTPESQHESIFVMGTLTGAVGGCITSLLGFVGLAAVFLPVEDTQIDEGIFQCLVQGVILLASLVLFGACSLLTGSEDLPANAIAYSCVDSEVSTGERTSDTESILAYGAVDDSEDKSVHRNENEVGLEVYNTVDLQSGSTENNNGSCNSGNAPFLKPKESKSTKSRRRLKQRVCLLMMTFFGLCTNDAYFVYVTNYVAEVIFDGDPLGEAGSQAYQNYLYGEHIASLGMLTFYCLFVVFNVFHMQIIKRIGMRAEYMAASIGCCAMMLTLALTNNIIVFFLNAITVAMLRSAVYTIPYILSNNYTLDELKEDSASGEASPSSAKSGTGMASVTAMIPASYFIVSLVMGPLMAITGNPGAPILCSATTCFLSILSTFFVEF